MEFSGLQRRSTNYIGGVELLKLLNVLLLVALCCCCCCVQKSRALQIKRSQNCGGVGEEGVACDSKGIYVNI